MIIHQKSPFRKPLVQYFLHPSNSVTALSTKDVTRTQNSLQF